MGGVAYSDLAFYLHKENPLTVEQAIASSELYLALHMPVASGMDEVLGSTLAITQGEVGNVSSGSEPRMQPTPGMSADELVEDMFAKAGVYAVQRTGGQRPKVKADTAPKDGTKKKARKGNEQGGEGRRAHKESRKEVTSREPLDSGPKLPERRNITLPTLGRCYKCGQPGHFVRDCYMRTGQRVVHVVCCNCYDPGVCYEGEEN